MKRLPVFLIVFLSCCALSGQQRYVTSAGEVHFNASTPLEDIDAVNNKVHAIIKEDSGEFAVALLIKDFNFRRKLMQEHFNENYMESETYPRASFSGKILGIGGAPLDAAAGSHVIEGKLTIHGVSHAIETTATVAKNNDNLILDSQILIAPEDYGIEVPRILFQKIAQEVLVEIKLELDKKEGSR